MRCPGCFGGRETDSYERLTPHESPTTDVILLGHSMGGILSSDVVLLAPYNGDNREPFVHRILGTINFDTPFLGMHPGVIASGLGSLFRPSPQSPKAQPVDANRTENAMLPIPANDEAMTGGSFDGSSLTGQSSTIYNQASQNNSLATFSSLSPVASPSNDPNYNPRFENDVILPVRKGWQSALHFINKHSDGLVKATKSYVTSHFEFGGTMADYKGLKNRYRRIRELEDVDDLRVTPSHEYRPPRRVRFVNFYTASTGRPSRKSSAENSPDGRERQSSTLQLPPPESGRSDNSSTRTPIEKRSRSPSPRIAVEDPQGEIVQEVVPESETTDMAGSEAMKANVSDKKDSQQTDADHKEAPTQDQSLPPEQAEIPGLPPIPPEPTRPSTPDQSQYQDEDVRKLVEKEHTRQLKAYTRACKDREKAIKERQKILAKREKKAKLEEERAAKKGKKTVSMVEQKAQDQEDAELPLRGRTNDNATPNEIPREQDSTQTETDSKVENKEKKKRDKKFCILPSKDSNGNRDPAWVRVFMEGVDEVGAHCGLFLIERPHYEQFVNDISAKVAEWIERDKLVRERLSEHV